MLDKSPCPLFAWDVTALQFMRLLLHTTFSPLHYTVHGFTSFQILNTFFTNLINDSQKWIWYQGILCQVLQLKLKSCNVFLRQISLSHHSTIWPTITDFFPERKWFSLSNSDTTELLSFQFSRKNPSCLDLSWHQLDEL